MISLNKTNKDIEKENNDYCKKKGLTKNETDTLMKCKRQLSLRLPCFSDNDKKDILNSLPQSTLDELTKAIIKQNKNI